MRSRYPNYSLAACGTAVVLAAALAACGGGADPVAGTSAGVSPTERALQASSAAATSGSGGETVYTEAGKLVRAEPTIAALDSGLFGDRVNLYNGALEFAQTDLSLPGNSALPLSVGRKLATGAVSTTSFTFGGLFGDWDLEIPRMHGVFAESKGWQVGGAAADINKRCSLYRAPPPALGQSNQGTFSAEEFWHGSFLYVPNAGSQELLTRNAATPFPTDGNAYPLATKGQWVIRCLPTLQRGAGEGFVAVSPDGTQYRFDWMVSRPYTVLSKATPGPLLLASSSAAVTTQQPGATQEKVAPAGAVPITPNVAIGYLLKRVEVWVLPTLVTDRFGNTLAYTYDSALPWRVNTILASDAAGSPRSLTFSYDGTSNRVASVTDGTRTWSYTYRSTPGGMVLSGVTQPDQSTWSFNLDALTMTAGLSQEGATCDSDISLNTMLAQGTITHPSGATGSFAIAGTPHGRSHVDRVCRGNLTDGEWSLFPKYIDAYSIQSKTISGPGMAPATWTYSYGPANASFAPCAGCAETKTVSVTDPHAVVTRYTFGNRFRVNEGQLLQVDNAWDGSSAQRVTTNQYRSPSAGPYADPIGTSPQPRTTGDLAYRHTPQAARVITQQGSAFTWQANAFDTYARTSSVTRSSSLGPTRTETTTYSDHLGKWVLGQVASVTEASTGGVVQSHSYDLVTANRTASYAFARLTDSYSYNADGTLLTRSDGASHATTFTNYKRGLAQNISYADGTAESAVVNNLGLITAHTNPAGTTTGYSYDAMGRLASITPPGGDPVAYHSTTLLFEKVASAELGIAAGHWRQTVATGNARTVRYFDGLWRERLSTAWDTANPAATSVAVETRYDADGRKLFTSYAQRSIAAVDGALPGVSSIYDGLGRITSQVQASELGNLSTSTAYLAGFQRQVTNPRNFITTTSFYAWDSPSEELVASIAAPEGVNVAIARDVFGKPTAITRSGGSASATRAYVYDANQRLCKSIEPESGATVQAYDAANNLAWRASGTTLTGTTACDQASVPANRKISYGYDTRNRLTSTTYGDASPGVTRSYTADGLPYQVTSAGATWTYGYNNRRLLASESLAHTSGSYTFTRGIDAYGNLASLSYPGGPTVAYSPDALGRPTQVSGFASAVSHHPNGAIAGYTLANGIVHSTTQNTRGLPLVWRDAGVVQDLYAFDANANVGSITDQQEGLTNRSLGYDGLDRLSSAAGTWGAGSFGYDALDNLRTSTIGARSLNHNIDAATNRLASLSGSLSIGFGYDANGNITARGSQGYSFDIGNRLASAAGKATYAYDGHGRRIWVAYAGGATKLQVYGQAGQLLFSNHSTQGSTKHIYLGSRLIAEVNSVSSTSYGHTDALGSPIARTNASGALLSRTRYEPYGATAAGTNPTGIGFTGHVNDADTGLVYMQQRYYDPIAGRFLSVDPVTTNANNGSSFNRYVYGNNNPYTFKDADGRQAAEYLSCDCGGRSDLPTSPIVTLQILAHQHGVDPASVTNAAALTTAFIARGKAGWVSAAKGIGTRVEAMHGVLDPIAAGRRTTAALDTAEGTRVLAAGGRDLSKAQRALMVPGEVAAKLPGAHAEVTALQHAAQNGLTPAQMAVSRTICPTCRAAIEQSGGQLTSPTTAIWPR
jgi:RHS repeat-associated protein